MSASTTKPSDGAILERAFSLVNHAMFTIDLQRRRVRSTEPEDKVFLFRRWADLQFLIVALQRLRRAATLATQVASVKADIKAAIAVYDAALPMLKIMRNVGEHIDDYAIDSPKRHHRNVTRYQLQVGRFDGTTYDWLDSSLNVDEAQSAAQCLYKAVRLALKTFPKEAVNRT